MSIATRPAPSHPAVLREPPFASTADSNQVPRPRTVWWLRPEWFVLVFVIPTAVGALTIPAGDYILNWGTPKYFNATALFSIIAAALLFIVPAVVVRRVSARPVARNLWVSELQPRELRFALTAYRVMFVLTVAGYAIWMFLAVSRGVSVDELKSLFSDRTTAYALKTTLAPVTGLTTLSQFGIPVAGLGTFLFLRTRRRTLLVGVGIVLLLSTLRAFVFSERLALIEVAIVVLAVSVQHFVANGGLGRRRKMALLPLALVPLVLIIFAGFEYTRSWQFYSVTTSQSNLLAFSAERLEGYYATSYNNSVILDRGFWLPGEAHAPFFSVEFVWEFPLLKGFAYNAVTGVDPQPRWFAALALYGNPEFSNPGGISAPLADFGAPLGYLFLAMSGMIVAVVFRRFVLGDPLGVMMYPILFVGLAELPREFYWAAGRAFPALLAAIVVGLTWQRRRGSGSDGARAGNRSAQ